MTTNREIQVHVLADPVKAATEMRLPAESINEQFEIAKSALVAVDYHAVPGTCGDERPRVGLLNGESSVEPRPSVFGGPNIYGLAIAELTGVIPETIETADERLHAVTDKLEAAGLLSGGHSHCAANAGFNSWLGVIAAKPEAVKAYAKSQLGDSYDDNAFNEVSANAAAAVASGHYAEWREDNLLRELGQEKAGKAIEVLADTPHEGVTLARQKKDGMTIDQTAVFSRSVAGKGTFVHDDPYAKLIESIVTSGPEAVYHAQLAVHAREAVIAAVASVVPNELLYQADIF